MTRCLIVSSLDKSLDVLSPLVKAEDATIIVSAKNACEARLILKKETFDLVLINTPLADEFGSELIVDVAQSSASGALLLVKKQVLEEVSNKLNKYGVMCVGKPLNKEMFTQAISLAISTNHRMKDIQNENKRLQDEVEIIKLIQRAKDVLIKYLNMSEAQAHHHIEKKAMDHRVSKEVIAKEILKTYD